MKPKKKKHPSKPRGRPSSIGTESYDAGVAREVHEPRDVERDDVPTEIGPDERGEIDRRDEE